jgi:hypothetical protein
LPLPLALPFQPGLRFSGCPVPRTLWLLRRRFPGLPRFLVLWLCRRLISRLPRISRSSTLLVSAIPRVAPLPRSPCNAFDTSLGCPSAASSGSCRRWICRFPRASHLSAVPTRQLAGCPACWFFGIADDLLPGLPRFLGLPAPAGSLPSYPGAHSLRFAFRVLPGYPGSTLPARLRTAFQVTLNLRSACVVLRLFARLPRLLPLDCPSMLPRVTPFPHLRLGR